jgi:AcrR family transcriptional regulator
MSMVVSYEHSGRSRQKARTRDALVAAARTLLAGGSTPTVEEAAATAGISRATAYRYFRNQRALLAATHPEVEAPSLLGPDAPADPAARLDQAVDEFLRMMLKTETELRTALRLSLEPDLDDEHGQILRTGRAIGWFEDALSPLAGRMPARELRRLVLALRAAVGIEALVWLTDVAGLSREEAADVMRWSARGLLRAAVEPSGG